MQDLKSEEKYVIIYKILSRRDTMNPHTRHTGYKQYNDGLAAQRQWPGQKYWILLVVTIILLLSCTATLIVLLLTESDGYSSSIGSSSSPSKDKNTHIADDPHENSSPNKQTLAPTTPSLNNYIAITSPYVAEIGGLIDSNNTILVEIGNATCTSIAEKDADMRIYPASMTKVMSLLVACENLNDISKTLTVSEEIAIYAAENEGSGFGLKIGEELTIKDLLYLTSYQSDTIAILTLAEHISGSEAAFVELMNEKAAELGLTNTHFSNCTGLHDDDNYTTCREMAAIMAYALDNPLCRELLTSYKGYRLITNKHPEEDLCTFYSTWYSGRFRDNPRLETVVIKGGKTGYTDEAGVCLVTFAESKATDKTYINVIVGRPKGSGLSESISTSEVKKIYNTYAE